MSNTHYLTWTELDSDTTHRVEGNSEDIGKLYTMLRACCSDQEGGTIEELLSGQMKN